MATVQNRSGEKKSDYILLRSGQLVGTALIVLCLKDIVGDVRNVEVATKKVRVASLVCLADAKLIFLRSTDWSQRNGRQQYVFFSPFLYLSAPPRANVTFDLSQRARSQFALIIVQLRSVSSRHISQRDTRTSKRGIKITSLSTMACISLEGKQFPIMSEHHLPFSLQARWRQY
jgi:hypothetical protein